ncbi:hypothetical protein ACAF76_006225 [Brevibacillus sp. TJ4]|uniref:hypothetical protein n=1 Tax=Brevibacillus sp. TJ4 TaxID=3234853 RepID=UPI003BA14A1A
MAGDNDIVTCDHCGNFFYLWELVKLTKKECSIISQEDHYLVCEYCTGKIQSIGEGVEEVQYWNSWVRQKRLASK